MSNIYDVYGVDYTNQIFDKFDSMPWGTIDASKLNLLYSVHSSNKTISPLVERLMVDGKLSDEAKQTIATTLSIMFKENWTYLWKALYADYNPIYNYGMTESESSNETGNETTTNDKSITTESEGWVSKETNDKSDNTTTDNNSSTTEDLNTVNSSMTSETDNSVYGYNSENAVNDNKSITKSTEATTNKDNSTVTNNGSTVTNYGAESSEDTNTTDNSKSTEADKGTKDSTSNTTRVLTREGNIGVTTSQQMIESELKLRNTKYWDLVFKDIDSLLTLSIY